MTHPKSVAASVIIPVYNGANYITQQLDALAVQTGNPSFEVLVCDNGSTDDTRAVVESYNASYPLRVVEMHPSAPEPVTPAIWGRCRPWAMFLSSAMAMIS